MKQEPRKAGTRLSPMPGLLILWSTSLLRSGPSRQELRQSPMPLDESIQLFEDDGISAGIAKRGFLRMFSGYGIERETKIVTVPLA